MRLDVYDYGRLDLSKPEDVAAALAFPWAQFRGPWLFGTPQSGPEMEAMAERVMRAARADPALFAGVLASDSAAFETMRATAVADTPELAAGFNASNLTLMRAGRAPYPPRSAQVIVQGIGELSNRRWELHHDPAIRDGGAVYDMSTLRVVTPKQHDASGSKE